MPQAMACFWLAGMALSRASRAGLAEIAKKQGDELTFERRLLHELRDRDRRDKSR